MIAPEQFRKLYHSEDHTHRVLVASENLAHLLRVMELLPKKRTALEIGCFTGGTTAWLLTTGGFQTVDVIDTFQGSPEHEKRTVPIRFEFSRRTWDYRDRIKVFSGRSSDVLPTLPKATTFDLIYVDGSHDSRDVLLDAMQAWPLLKPGGIMVFDDYGWNYYEDPFRNPKPAIDWFVQCFASQLKVLEVGYQVSVQKL